MASSTPSRAKGMFVSALKWGLAAGFLALVGLVVAVAVAMASLPDYQQLTPAVRPRPDGPGARRRRHLAGVARAELRPLAEL